MSEDRTDGDGYTIAYRFESRPVVKLHVNYGPTSDHLIEDVVERLQWRLDKKDVPNVFVGDALIVDVTLKNFKFVLDEFERIGYVRDLIADDIEALLDEEVGS